VPVVSTVAVTAVEPSAPAAKLCPMTLMVLSELIGTAVEVSMFLATSMVPQGVLNPVKGCTSSSVTSTPPFAMPRAGTVMTSPTTGWKTAKTRAQVEMRAAETMMLNQVD